MSESKWAIEIGSHVHFVCGDKHLPAIITDPAVDGVMDDGRTIPGIEQALTVFPVGDLPFTTQAIQDERRTPATWHWPEWTTVAPIDSDGGTGGGEPCEASDVPTTMPTISREGDHVLYVLDRGPYAGESRPATVVKVWDAYAGYVNLVVLLDGSNDDPTAPFPAPLLRWVTSVRFDPDKTQRTWHWPE